VAILSPDDLFGQAEKLVMPPPAGPPRQVDLRRAISSAYYGLFHFVLRSVADEFVGVSQRTTPRYTLVYRSIAHRTLRDICTEAKRSTPSAKYAEYLPANGLGPFIQAFGTAAIDLQEKRHTADYNPRPRFKTLDAKVAIGAARSAIGRFERADQEDRKIFLTLLLCPLR
jgi:hypothetical protein